ncbi:gamma-glutamyltranspeptidase [Aspergillus steynii IBT 23096]|uniref:Glutathione hydrolase n=1 Tax=Aspergillus steynii IBT 23096 TaxID=1392250 RepID=A0A2I2GH52_9EURO|nr:gamma-glutamyltranspeptidase [Aspergillus steynii IBT 23096]PLB52211.1 gamma-glutamyltranspeptidase [Aspergillus steynii IBT 23096]
MMSPTMTPSTWTLVLCTLLLHLVGAHAYIHDFSFTGQQPLHESVNIAQDGYQKGAVASESRNCSEHGITMLEKGGTAADVMAATVLCVGVVNMYHSGIGGGGFMVIRYPDPKEDGGFGYETIDFREAAPAGAHQNMFEGIEDRAQVGGLASAVPGELRGLEYLLQNHGALTWKEVTEPAINAARYGVPVTEDLKNYMNRAVGNGEDFLLKYPWSETFARPDGTRVRVNDTIKRTKYADTLEAIAKDNNLKSFYEGDIAESIAKAVQDNDGIMTVEDLKNYTVIKRGPLHVSYGDYKLTSIRAPASGFIALNALKVLSNYEDFFNGSEETMSLDTHRMVEAMRFGYAMRPKLGDPAGKAYIEKFQEDMLTDEATYNIYKSINDTTTFEEDHYNPGGYGIPKGGGTSHLVAADDSGLAISLITSVNLFFGSHVMDNETGIILNDSMDDFSIPGTRNAFNYVPAPENFIRPRKRPHSSMSPLIVTGKDKFTFLTGSAGGSHITSTTIQNTLHVLNQGLNASATLAKARLHDQVNPYYCSFEHGRGFDVHTEKYNESIVAYMAGLGHNVSWIMPGLSTSQAVLWSAEGGFDGAGEPRQQNSGWAGK